MARRHRGQEALSFPRPSASPMIDLSTMNGGKQLEVFHSNKGADGDRPQNWATPLPLYREIEEAFAGREGFALDACAEEWNAKAPFYFDEQLDALSLDRPWHVTRDARVNEHAEERNPSAIYDPLGGMREAPVFGRRDVWVWCNPPYNAIDAFVAKAIRELDAGAYAGCVFLFPNRSDREWWHRLVKPRAWHIEEIQGRVNFVAPPGAEITAAGGYEPSVVVVFRNGIRGRA